MFRPLLTLALLAVLAAAGRAQSVSIISISPSVVLAASTADFNLSTGSGAVNSISAISSRIRSTSRPWALNVRATSPTFSHSPLAGVSPTTKSIANLLIRQNGTSTYSAVSTTDTILASGANTVGGGVNVDMDLRFDTSLSDSPGSYAATLVFTIITL